MKIATTLAGKYASSTIIRKQLYDTHVRTFEGPTLDAHLQAAGVTKEDFFTEARYLIMNDFSDSKVFLVRSTAMEIARKIKISEEKHFDYLSRVPEGDYVFITGKDSFISFFNIVGRFVVLSVQGGEYLHYTMFNFHIASGYEQIGDDKPSREACELFLQLCIFWQFAEPGEIILPPGRKNGTRNTEKVFNDSPFTVKILDSNWGKTIIRPDGFSVSGHLRLQPHGPERKDRKLIWIEPFEKKGYVRKNQ